MIAKIASFIVRIDRPYDFDKMYTHLIYLHNSHHWQTVRIVLVDWWILKAQ